MEVPDSGSSRAASEASCRSGLKECGAPVAEGSAGREHAAEEGVGRRRKGMTGCSLDRRMAVILALLRHGAGP